MKKMIKLIMLFVLSGILASACGLKDKEAQLAYRETGIEYLNSGDYENAISYLTMALQESKGKVKDLEKDISYYLAEAEYKNGNLEEAIEIYSNLLHVDKKNVDAYYLRGLAYLSSENLKLGKEDFDKALSLEKNEYSLVILISKNLIEGGYSAEANEYLKKALEISGDKLDNYLGRGKVYYYLAEYDAALSELRQADEKGSMEALFYLGLTYEKLDDIDGAIVQYEKYIETDDDKGQVYNQLGLCKLKKKDYEAGLASIQKGINEGDGTALQELFLNEIAAYEYLGDFESARSKMEIYLESYPDDKEAAREYEFLKSR